MGKKLFLILALFYHNLNESSSVARGFIPYPMPTTRDRRYIYVHVQGISIFYDSPLKRGDKGVCKFAVTHPRPLFLEGSLKVATEGSLIYSLR